MAQRSRCFGQSPISRIIGNLKNRLVRFRQACGRGHAGAVDLSFETMAFWIAIAYHKAGHTLAIGKHHKLWDFADGGVRGKELTHEESLGSGDGGRGEGAD